MSTTTDKRSPSSAWACTRGASGAATSSSTASSPRTGARRRRACSGTTSSSWPAPTPSATATRATSPAPRSARRSAGRATAWPAATPPVPRAPRRSTSPAPRSSPASATSRSSSAPTPRPKGFFAPLGGDRPDDPDWLRFRLLGATNPTYFALYARRRMELLRRHRGRLRQGAGQERRHGLANPNARYRKEFTEDEVLASADGRRPAAPARDLRHLRRRRRHRAHEHGLRPARTPPTRSGSRPSRRSRRRIPQTVLEMPDFATDSAAVVAPPDRPFRDAIAARRLRGGRPRVPTTSTWPRSTTCRRPSSSTGTRTSACAPRARPSSCSATATTAIGGRIPVNPSGGLACFGEAIPAQAIAQVCELTWQLRGQAGGRQVEGARVGSTVNQGLFGHGSSVILKR